MIARNIPDPVNHQRGSLFIAIPRELPRSQYADLIRDCCRESFVSRGMIADFAIYDKGDGTMVSHFFHKKISTHLLTVLIIGVILQLEQRKEGMKKRNQRFPDFRFGKRKMKRSARERRMNSADSHRIVNWKGDMTYVTAQHFWRKLI